MTDEEFYGDALSLLRESERILCGMVERYLEMTGNSARIKPVEKYQSRIKSSQSMIEKLERLNLEHELKYKKTIEQEFLIRSELKRCADEIAGTDLSMQTIRDIIGSL